MTIYLIIHLICAFLTYGITFAYWQRTTYPSIAEKEYRVDMAMSVFLGLVYGPAGLFVAFFASGFCQYGFKIK